MDTRENGEPEQTNSDARSRRKKERRITLKDYIAGIVLAAAPSWIFSVLVLTNPIEDTFNLILICFFITAGGGVFAGYLSARHSFESPLRMAVFSGIGSYALLAIVNWMMRVNPVYDMGAILGFPIGFAVGSRLIELKRIRS